jgi:hypothetical protein
MSSGGVQLVEEYGWNCRVKRRERSFASTGAAWRTSPAEAVSGASERVTA